MNEETYRDQHGRAGVVLSDEDYRQAVHEGRAAVASYLGLRLEDRGGPENSRAAARTADDPGNGRRRAGTAGSLLRRPSALVGLGLIVAVAAVAAAQLSHNSPAIQSKPTPGVNKAPAVAAQAAHRQRVKQKPQTYLRTAAVIAPSRASPPRARPAASAAAASGARAGGGTHAARNTQGAANGSSGAGGSHQYTSSQSDQRSSSGGSVQPGGGSSYSAASAPTRGSAPPQHATPPSPSRPTETSTRSRPAGATRAGGITINGGG